MEGLVVFLRTTRYESERSRAEAEEERRMVMKRVGMEGRRMTVL